MEEGCGKEGKVKTETGEGTRAKKIKRKFGRDGGGETKKMNLRGADRDSLGVCPTNSSFPFFPFKHIAPVHTLTLILARMYVIQMQTYTRVRPY